MTTENTPRIRRALISVTDKIGVVEFASALVELGAEIVSTGGTAAVLRDAGVAVTDVAEVTGFPEILDGRVKTLHPKIHGGVLARRDAEHAAQLEAHGINPIDLVAVNLYAFEDAASAPDATIEDAIEQIDIGGPTLLRAAAKNHAFVVPLVDPRDYQRVIDALAADGLSLEARRGLALKVFQHTQHYDQAIAQYLTTKIEGDDGALPDTFSMELRKVQDLRYGENPHQSAAFYTDNNPPPTSLARAEQLNGKALSFNNLLDADSALALAMDLGERSAVFVKHNNPCGAAVADDLIEAIHKARACDPVSAFGAVVAIARPIDLATAELLAETFIEVVVAPSYTPEALERLQTKKNLRLLAVGPFGLPPAGRDVRRISGGLLVQTKDAGHDPAREVAGAKVATKRSPTAQEMDGLAFNWAVAKHVRSNAIVFGHADRSVAVGAGQMSRVDAVKLCRLKGGDALKGAVVASDAFFPFRDGIDILAAAGASAIVQPGGSIRDEEVIAAADEHGLAMVLTGVRHFRH